MSYLQGPGEENEHTRPHAVAGHRSVMRRDYAESLNRTQALAIARDIDLPRRLHGTEVKVPNYIRDSEGRTVFGADGRPVVHPLRPTRDGHVWHCSLSLHPDEGSLPDAKWAKIASDFMNIMEFAGPASGRADARWIAIHHGLSVRGNDHIHIAAGAVREDGTRVNTYNDYARAQQACKTLEERYGLRVVLGRHDGRTTRGYDRAQINTAARAAGIDREEAKQAMREGVIEPAAVQLDRAVRASLAASRSEAEFVDTLRERGVLLTRARDKDTGEVRGWCVALRPSPTTGRRGARPVFLGGGSVARDLSLPRLRNNWDDTTEERERAEGHWHAAELEAAAYSSGAADPRSIPAAVGTAAAPRRAHVDAAAAELQRWVNQFASIPATDTVAWAAAARQAAGVFAAWSLANEPRPGPMARLSRELAQHAVLPAHRDAPQPMWQRRNSASGWATILLATRPGADPALANMAVLHQLSRLIEAIASASFAAGDAARARHLSNLTTGTLAAIQQQFATLGAGPETASDAPLDAARPQARDAAQIARLTFGQPAPRRGRASAPSPSRDIVASFDRFADPNAADTRHLDDEPPLLDLERPVTGSVGGERRADALEQQFDQGDLAEPPNSPPRGRADGGHSPSQSERSTRESAHEPGRTRDRDQGV
ncbi:relaxase/mobilization nuclease domain-containing protein [Nocardia takedensis]|uniref:relaxase/mobilization nuclease domain-containing protein n=1 Tax=Nocardia takedensis TaxID=259390 RepID=UPI003F76BFED